MIDNINSCHYFSKLICISSQFFFGGDENLKILFMWHDAIFFKTHKKYICLNQWHVYIKKKLILHEIVYSILKMYCDFYQNIIYSASSVRYWPSTGTSTDRLPAGDHMYSLLVPVHRARRDWRGSHSTSKINIRTSFIWYSTVGK